MRWLLNAIVLMGLAQVLPGLEIRGFFNALLFVLVLSFLNLTLNPLLQLLSLPLTVLTVGLFYFVVNAIVVKVAAAFFGSISITFFSALVVAVVLALINTHLD